MLRECAPWQIRALDKEDRRSYLIDKASSISLASLEVSFARVQGGEEAVKRRDFRIMHFPRRTNFSVGGSTDTIRQQPWAAFVSDNGENLRQTAFSTHAQQ